MTTFTKSEKVATRHPRKEKENRGSNIMTNTPESKQTNFLLYTNHEGKVNIEVFLKDETVWLTQKAMGELFGVQRSAVTKHLKNIFDSGELVENSVSSILEHTAIDGKIYKTRFYNLDAIISVGYFDREIKRITGKKYGK